MSLGRGVGPAHGYLADAHETYEARARPQGVVPNLVGDQGPRLERKLTHIPFAQLPMAMTAPKTVNVMRPINSV
jgi:hypothetical protein